MLSGILSCHEKSCVVAAPKVLVKKGFQDLRIMCVAEFQSLWL
ncbi:hypothetical protein [Streptomyces virginiae]